MARDQFLIEGTARWADYEVSPRYRGCQGAGILTLLLGGTDVDSKKYAFPGYGGWLFWRYVADRYGGAELIRRLFEVIKTEGWPAWRRELGKLVDKPFLELWTEFAVALAAREIRDSQWLYPRAEERTSYVPVPVFIGEWTGQKALTIKQSNWENPYPQFCSVPQTPSGSIELCPPATEIINSGAPLVVRHPYGIHFLRITPKSEKSLALRFHGNPDTEFRVYLVAQRALGQHEIFALQAECVLSQPAAYALLHVVVTRGEKGSGEYQLNLQQPQNPDIPQCQRLAHR